MDAVDLVHGDHHRPTIGSQDEHAWQRTPDCCAGRRDRHLEQVGQRYAGHQCTADIGHTLQYPRALVRQRVHRLHGRDLRQTGGGQGQPLLAQTEQ